MVNLYITHPEYTIQFDFGIEKIGTGMRVAQACIDYFYQLSCRGSKLFQR
jgi:hypothetical protein